MQKRSLAIIRELSRDFNIPDKDIEHLIINYYEELKRVLNTGDIENEKELPAVLIPHFGKITPNIEKIYAVRKYRRENPNYRVQRNYPVRWKKNKSVQQRQPTKAERLIASRELRRIQDKTKAEQARNKAKAKRKALLELLKLWRGDKSKYGKGNTKAARESRKLNKVNNLNTNTDGSRIE